MLVSPGDALGRLPSSYKLSGTYNDLTGPETSREMTLPGTCVRRRFPTSGWTQYAVLQGRAVKAYTRNPANVAGRTMMSIVLGVIGGLVFYNRGVGARSKPVCLIGRVAAASKGCLVSLLQSTCSFP